jgi:hypothetical protein
MRSCSFEKIIDSLQRINNNAKVITLGDLNDGPFNNSVKKSARCQSEKLMWRLAFIILLEEWLKFGTIF